MCKFIPVMMLTFVFGCAETQMDQAGVEGQIVGGFSEVAVSDSAVASIQAFLINALRSGHQLEVTRVIKVERQVVAGTNYRFTLLMSDGNTYQAVVYEDLQRNLTLTHFEPTTN
ncbi:MAG: hypothetical protein HWE20_01095 [Gammaproteobacteria bacterium]|nr:hypothetical protein [Gammaproteobacteria bacterium]